MDELNISQLRNLWLRSPDERLTNWRQFRISLQSHYDLYESNGTADDRSILLSSLEQISTWWEQVPTVSVAIDPYSPIKIPSVWEIIQQGECCKYSRGLAMAYNIHYMDRDVLVTADRVKDHILNDEYMVATYGGTYALNSPHGTIINLHDVDGLEIRESWDIKTTIANNQY